MGKLTLDIRQGDVLNIGDSQIRLIAKSGKSSRLEITAPQIINISLEHNKCASLILEAQVHG
ncbi:hypothetical protein B9T36_09620 [Acinetobacter sp. ANC 4204]|uniref:hypothetical protein n=1 Tax=unclassified Acinetobacter TaxID=196816 RepID=UPI000A33380D|nr:MULTISPECIES: hypothetical protein [unclassified Acinetobacter]OTG58605.1 hypothetical protein B9T36_09620 [Acinetobacter sp. ANC 4204]RGD90567.1 hypothetical protein DYI96_10380 [Acinetobacter sp. SWAC57]